MGNIWADLQKENSAPAKSTQFVQNAREGSPCGLYQKGLAPRCGAFIRPVRWPNKTLLETLRFKHRIPANSTALLSVPYSVGISVEISNSPYLEGILPQISPGPRRFVTG